MMDLILNKINQSSDNSLFTREEVLSLLAMNETNSGCLNLLKKMLLLSDELIYTKAVAIEFIIKNNPALLNENCEITNEVYKMREIARDKIITVINKFYKVDFNESEDSFEYILLLYIWAMQRRGIEINEDGCLFLWSIEEQEDSTYLMLNPSFMDEIVTLLNGNYEGNLIVSILESEDSLYEILVELLGAKQVSKSLEMKEQ